MTEIIDFHAHILPGADHGSKSIETSLKQLALMKSAGVTTVVATPHFYPTSMNVEDFLHMRKKCEETLASSEAKNMGIHVVAAAEVLVCEEMEHMKGLEKLRIPGTDCMLLEMPTTRWSSELYETVERITENHTVILAHIDRYPLSDVLQFLEFDNVFAQMNPSELTKLFIQRKYLELIDRGWVVALGSDLHFLHSSSEKNEKQMELFSKAIKKIGNKRTEKIMGTTAEILKTAEYII